MARSRGFPRGLGTSRRRKVSWDAGPGGTSGLAVATTTPVFLGSAVSLATGVSLVTVVRIRGRFLIVLKTTAAAGTGFTGAVAIGKASLAAVTAGIASVPTPITEVFSDNWLWYSHFQCISGGIISSGAATATPLSSGVVSLEIDSKAMRILKTEDALYAVVQLFEQGTATAEVFLDTRILGRLP